MRLSTTYYYYLSSFLVIPFYGRLNMHYGRGLNMQIKTVTKESDRMCYEQQILCLAFLRPIMAINT